MIYGPRCGSFSLARPAYIGAAVLDALVRGGHDVTALVRDNEKARRVAKRGGHPVVGDLAEPESFRGSADGAGRLRARGVRRASGRGPAIEQAALETMIAAAKRPRTAGVDRAGQAVRHLHVGRLDPRPDAGAGDRGRADQSDRSSSSFRPAHEQLVLDAASDTLRTVVVRPGVVYGGGNGMVGDIFKAASNGLVRVVGDGNNHWPLVYDRDLADLYARLAAHDDASGIYHANDEGDERVNDIVGRDQAVPAGEAGRAARADRGSAAQDGRVRRRAGARSGGAQPARPRARLDADAALGRRQRRAPAGRVARVAELDVAEA